jgi:hypothetical protein
VTHLGKLPEEGVPGVSAPQVGVDEVQGEGLGAARLAHQEDGDAVQDGHHRHKHVLQDRLVGGDACKAGGQGEESWEASMALREISKCSVNDGCCGDRCLMVEWEGLKGWGEDTV